MKVFGRDDHHEDEKAKLHTQTRCSGVESWSRYTNVCDVTDRR
jgi:hypothetical protein